MTFPVHKLTSPFPFARDSWRCRESSNLRAELPVKAEEFRTSTYTCKNGVGGRQVSAARIRTSTSVTQAVPMALSPRIFAGTWKSGRHSLNVEHMNSSEAAFCCRDVENITASRVFVVWRNRLLFDSFGIPFKRPGLPSSYMLFLTGVSRRQIRHFTATRPIGTMFFSVESNFRRSGAKKTLNFTVDLKVRDRAFRFSGRGVQGAVRLLRMALYDDFVQFSVDKVCHHSKLSPITMKNGYDNMVALDGKTIIRNLAMKSENIRLFRTSTIDGGETMQVLNVAIFAELKYDLPIFCADFFSTSKANIIVLDLNPLYSTEQNPDYKKKYYASLLSMANKYVKLLPWGGKLTAESLQFFSPIVIWAKPIKSSGVQEILFAAFQDYLLAWLNLLEIASEASDSMVVARNQEAQHRYLMWRATKDPGRPILSKLLGEVASEKYIHEVLFDGVQSLGSKTFLDYFPAYRSVDGSLSTIRSMAGKSYLKRPWGEDGNLIQPAEI